MILSNKLYCRLVNIDNLRHQQVYFMPMRNWNNGKTLAKETSVFVCLIPIRNW